MLLCMIDMKEWHDVVIADILGAFMQTDLDEMVHMHLDGPMAKLLLKINLELYRKYLMWDGKKSVMYVELCKALYRTLNAALLFWQNLSKKLMEWGFEQNPYDWCMVNKTIDGKQCTVLWHIDDLKISHVESKIVDGILNRLETEYRKEVPITVTRGKVHDYLGMMLNFREEGKVKISMVVYIEKMLAELPPDMDGTAPTPATNHLFQVNTSDPEKLNKDMADKFHQNVAKLLFLCKCAWPDIQMAVAFECMHVKELDRDDYKKLAQKKKYLRGTKNLPLVLEADDSGMIKWWVNGSFAVHEDMRSHTGGTMSLGKGAAYATSTWQKLNMKSSTEAELVAVDDIMPQVIWMRNFLEVQGYNVTDNVVFQDNQSTMLLEKNGKQSSSKWTQHINICYFFITDQIESKEMSVEYCPTGKMLGDFFMKQLQGASFRKFHNQILSDEEIRKYMANDTVDKMADEQLGSKPMHHRSVLGKNDR